MYSSIKLQPSQPVEITPDSGGASWRTDEQAALFPKPGGGARKAFLLRRLVSEAEIAALLMLADGLEFSRSNDSVDDRPAFEHYVIDRSAYRATPLAAAVRPLIAERVLPYVRAKCEFLHSHRSSHKNT